MSGQISELLETSHLIKKSQAQAYQKIFSTTGIAAQVILFFNPVCLKVDFPFLAAHSH
jgi:methionine salvage enolase-phosphatase E1